MLRLWPFLLAESREQTEGTSKSFEFDLEFNISNLSSEAVDLGISSTGSRPD